MRVRNAVMLGTVVLALCIAPITASAENSGTSPEVVSSAPIVAQDGTNETTTDDGMGNETMDDSMSNETMGNETMDDSMNETTMSDGNMSDSMGGTTMANESMANESMDDSMGTSEEMTNETTGMDDQMSEGNATADDSDGSNAFAPGFGVLTVLLAVVAVALYAARGR